MLERSHSDSVETLLTWSEQHLSKEYTIAIRTGIAALEPSDPRSVGFLTSEVTRILARNKELQFTSRQSYASRIRRAVYTYLGKAAPRYRRPHPVFLSQPPTPTPAQALEDEIGILCLAFSQCPRLRRHMMRAFQTAIELEEKSVSGE